MATQHKRSKKRENRERERLKRKVALAEQQAIQFEDELSGHELNLMRLDALPEQLRHDSHDDQRAAELRAIEQLKHGIENSLAEAERLRRDIGDD